MEKVDRIPTAFSPDAPDADNRYYGVRILSGADLTRPGREDEEVRDLLRRRELQILNSLGECFGARGGGTLQVNVTRGGERFFVNVEVTGGFTGQQLWNAENAILTTMVGPNGEAELMTELQGVVL